MKLFKEKKQPEVIKEIAAEQVKSELAKYQELIDKEKNERAKAAAEDWPNFIKAWSEKWNCELIRGLVAEGNALEWRDGVKANDVKK